MKLKKLITVLVLLCVIALNVLFGIISYKKLLYIDLTQPKYTSMTAFYTASESFLSAIDGNVIPEIDKINTQREADGEDALKVEIIFCMDSDRLDEAETTRLVHYTARTLASKYPEHVELSYTDVVKNPSSVQKYKVTSATRIYSTDVIITFGSEFNVHGLNSFYMTDTDTGEIWGYNGEKKFASTILSLTRADSPICALTTNHGEGLFESDGNSIKVKSEYSEFLKIIEGAGYDIQFIDLAVEEIPENCRMIITFAPAKDFFAYGNLSEGGVSEIEKLDRYLDGANSFFYICDTNTPELVNLEEYLSEWGIAPSYETTASDLRQNYGVYDSQNSKNAEGNVFVGQYASYGMGSSLTADLRALTYPPEAIFGTPSYISHSKNYEKNIVFTESGAQSVIYSYYKNGISRTMYDVFTTHESAYAQSGNKVIHAGENNLFSLFTLTEELNQVQEDSLNMADISSYVLGLSSTEFLKNEYLASSSCGNADILLSALRATSRETVPVSVDSKAFYDQTINETLFALTDKKTPVIILSVLPLTLCAAAGIVVCVRRKYL